MAYGNYRLQFLHISDLHAKGPQEKEPWRRRRVLGEAWLRNLETLIEEEGPIHFVLFTGDAAQSGKPEEYAEVTGFFHALCKTLDVSLERLFVVPGNHDIDRHVQTAAWKSMRMRLAVTTDQLGVSRWVNDIGSHPPLGFKDSWKTAILDRQQAYRAWVRDHLKRPELAPAGLGYRSPVQLPDWALPIHIVGLDTAWLCGDDADASRLLLTENQIGRHLTRDGDPLPGLRIVLMHHPMHELADATSARRMLSDHADIVLRGHLHQTEVVEWIDPDRRLRELASGSLYEGGLADTYGNSCHFVRLELDSGLRPIEAMVRFRSFSPRAGHWFNDNSLYRESKEGRTTWTFGAPDSLLQHGQHLVRHTERLYSCFISYSTKDQPFAERLHADLEANGVRCWFARHDIQSGKKLHEQIDDAIRAYDRLLLILSEHSMNSEWVKTEIAKARKKETLEERQVLFPIRLVDFETIKAWECLDADTGKDSAREIREYFLPDFSNWREDDSYEVALQRLLRDFKAQSKDAGLTQKFSPWTPRPEHCFGRASMFRRLESAFDERRSIWLVGDWRIGKTTTLLAWEKRLRERGVVVKLVSGHGPAGVSAAQFVESVTGLDSPPAADAAADRLTTWIDAASLPGLPPVVLVDEVESIVQSCDVRFFDRLRDLLGRLCLVFSSMEAPDEVFSRNSKASPITNRMEAVWVSLLEPGGDDATIRLGAGHLGPGDADLMHRWCGRHCYFLQLFGWFLVEAHRTGTDPDQALVDLQRQSTMHFRQLWRTVPPAQQQALRDAARGVPSHIGVLKQRGLLNEYGLPFGEVFAAWLRGESGS